MNWNESLGCTYTVSFSVESSGIYSIPEFQVGKFMKCKWHSESDEREFSDNQSRGQNVIPGFTTVSHSCQVFVTGAR